MTLDRKDLEAAQAYAERTANGRYPIEITRDRDIKTGLADFLAGLMYARQNPPSIQQEGQEIKYLIENERGEWYCPSIESHEHNSVYGWRTRNCMWTTDPNDLLLKKFDSKEEAEAERSLAEDIHCDCHVTEHIYSHSSPTRIQQEAIPEEKTLGQFLREAREERGISEFSVRQDTGISLEYLRKLEYDELKNPSAGVLWKLAKYYSIDLKPLAIKAEIIIKAPPSPPSVKTPAIPDQPSNRFTEGDILAHNPDKKFPSSEYEQKYGKSLQASNEADIAYVLRSRIKALESELSAIREEKETGDKFNESLIDQLKRELKSAHKEREEYRKELALSVLKWALDMHVSRAGKYWGKDYSNIAYDDKGIVEEYLKQHQ